MIAPKGRVDSGEAKNFQWELLDKSKTTCLIVISLLIKHYPYEIEVFLPDLLCLHDTFFMSFQTSRQPLLVKTHTLFILGVTVVFKFLCILFNNRNTARIKTI